MLLDLIQAWIAVVPLKFSSGYILIRHMMLTNTMLVRCTILAGGPRILQTIVITSAEQAPGFWEVIRLLGL